MHSRSVTPEGRQALAQSNVNSRMFFTSWSRTSIMQEPLTRGGLLLSHAVHRPESPD